MPTRTDSVPPTKPKDAIRIGTAGWNIPKDQQTTFDGAGTHLQRYGSQLNAVEINSSFYRPHRVQTYARWAASVPAEFLFSVKAPKAITHEMRLVGCAARIDQFVQEIAGLESKLGCVLVQLPPSLRFEREIASAFFATFRKSFGDSIVCEPRHVTWFTEKAEGVLVDYRVGRVAADPPVHAESALPAGCADLQYFRLHGSPKTYYSAYSSDYLRKLGETLIARNREGAAVWCVFDNTAEGYATANALELQRVLSHRAHQ